MTLLSKGCYHAMVESVWEQDRTYGPRWRWNFVIQHEGLTYKVCAYTPASLRSAKTRKYLEAVLERSVEPTEELYASYLGGESCTVQVGIIQKHGRNFHSIEDVL